MNFSVAIDGPAGAGKSTIAKIVAHKFGLMYINTGAMYRAVTFKALDENISYKEKDSLVELMNNLEMHFQNESLILNGENINSEINLPLISKNVSNYAAIPEVRHKLVALQQKIAEKYSVVMDGRDIGTVVLKNAPIKFFLTASAEERAKRRYSELMEKDIIVDFNEILNDIIKRDYIDSHRETDPLRKAEDAIEIDSSFMCIDEVVDKMSQYIVSFLEGNKKEES
ncbi:(d)CMP kinase [Candidatus Clostridium radicumherbarum]|uniref:Cytidylate kinase n=1 Tax=Candidatus Clostridium radicumherbarum TaxID=3381662 RepID=A0ABW8TSL6_9CLOT